MVIYQGIAGVLSANKNYCSRKQKKRNHKSMPTNIETSIALPRNFRLADFLAFHQRDAQMLSEIVSERQLHKGIIWEGMPACITFTFAKKQVDIILHIDSRRKKHDVEKIHARLQQHAQHMLGLNQTIGDFEKFIADNPQLNHLIAKQSGLRVPQAATTFEALTWAIIGQQISVSAAVSVRRNFIQHTGLKHSSGIWCYPSAAQVAALTEDDLRPLGFSHSKARTVVELGKIIHSGDLPLDNWLNDYWQGKPLAAQTIYDALIQVRGIGPWTVNYALLRGFGWLDGSLHGDAAVRRNLQQLLNTDEKPDEKTTQSWLAAFSPWRALVAAHLWAMQNAEGF
jgi:DNA-3-methyladenine glycosylase II